MRVLITGAFGYLGGRLAQFLSSRAGYEIVLGTRRRTGAPPWLPQAEVVLTQWNLPTSLDQICAGADAVVHLAGMNSQDCAADPAGAIEVNALGTARLLDAAIRQSVKRFIHLSTAHVYGSPLSGVISEKTCPLALHPYATSHRAGEDALRAAHERGDIEGIVIRLSNAFGAPAHADAKCWMLLVNDLCGQAVRTRRIVLRSSGLQARDFITLQDFGRAVDHLLKLSRDRCGDGLFNVGGEFAITVLDMAQRIAKCCGETMGYEPDVVRAQPGPGEATTMLRFEMHKLKQTGFELGGDMEAEIVGTLEFCNSTWATATSQSPQ